MKTRITLYAEEGMVLTDGTHYGTTVHLKVGEDASRFREITQAEHDAIKAAEEVAAQGGETG